MSKKLYPIITLVIILGIVANWQLRASAKQSKTEPFKFVQLCDPQLGIGGYQHDIDTFKQAVKQINKMKPDLVVICGDFVEKRDDKSFADFIKIRKGFTVPCYWAPGNHDLGVPTDETLKRYRKLFGKDYFSIEFKGYTFVFANSLLWEFQVKNESDKHHAWFIKTLKEAKRKGTPVFIVAHFLIFQDDPNEKKDVFMPLKTRKELLTLIKECGVVGYLAGHMHRTVINNYHGIPMVAGEVTSKNTDNRPLGFRLWEVYSPTEIYHELVPLEPIPSKPSVKLPSQKKSHPYHQVKPNAENKKTEAGYEDTVNILIMVAIAAVIILLISFPHWKNKISFSANNSP